MSATVSSVANISGKSNRQPRARLMSTPRPLSAPAHSPTMAPMTASVTPTRMPPRIWGVAAGQLQVPEYLPARGTQRAAQLEQALVHRADADHRRDRDRKEDDQRADDDLGQQTRAQPQDEQRREGQDRRRLRRDEIGR